MDVTYLHNLDSYFLTTPVGFVEIFFDSSCLFFAFESDESETTRGPVSFTGDMNIRNDWGKMFYWREMRSEWIIGGVNRKILDQQSTHSYSIRRGEGKRGKKGWWMWFDKNRRSFLFFGGSIFIDAGSPKLLAIAMSAPEVKTNPRGIPQAPFVVSFILSTCMERIGTWLYLLWF